MLPFLFFLLLPELFDKIAKALKSKDTQGLQKVISDMENIKNNNRLTADQAKLLDTTIENAKDEIEIIKERKN